MTKDNHQLGKFDLTNIPPAPRGVPQIEVNLFHLLSLAFSLFKIAECSALPIAASFHVFNLFSLLDLLDNTSTLTER